MNIEIDADPRDKGLKKQAESCEVEQLHILRIFLIFRLSNNIIIIISKRKFTIALTREDVAARNDFRSVCGRKTGPVKD